MKKFTMIAALLCASLLSFAIDWSGYQWLGDGAGGGAYSNKYKVAPAEGQNVVNIQKPGWTTEAGIYTTFPAGISSCSLPDGKFAIDGAGMSLYLSAFTAQETQVTVTHGLGTAVFTVYYADGTAGGGSGEQGGELTEIYDTNFALSSNGASATASSGTAGAAIDGNNGTRWESSGTTDEEKDAQVWTLDLGQLRIYNTIQIRWEGAYGKSFDIKSSVDGENWKTVKSVVDQTLAGFPYEQTLELAANDTARYIQFQGVARGTVYGYSFWEFRVLLPGTSTLTSISMSAAAGVAQVGGAGVALTVTPKDQNGQTMTADVQYEITPSGAGAVTDGKYIPAKIGAATIVAYVGDVRSQEVSVFGYEGSNLALSTNIDNDNKVIAQSDFAPDGTNAFFAVDGIEGSVYQGSATNGTAGDEASRTYDAWFVVDLGANYTIDLITIHFEGACSQDYHVDFSTDNTVWVEGYNHVGTAGINGRTDMLSTQLDNNLKVRYVRFWSTKAGTEWGMKIFEFQVFGHAWVPSGDTEAPVMVDASLASKTWNTAVINVEATDNEEVAKFHVVDATHEIDARLSAVDGKITITGLTAATAYSFTITAIDAANNESANSKVVAVTTEEHHIVPTASAPVPTWPAVQVKSIYSDAYEFAPASLNSYNEGWWDNPNMTQEDINGDHFLHYDLYRNGMIGVQFAETSVATMEKVHIDVYASAAGSVTFRLITVGDDAVNGTSKTLTLAAEQWNSFDFTLADFGAHNWTRLFQYAIEGYQAGGLVGEHISVDNIYFYRETALVDEEDPTNVTASVASTNYFGGVLTVSANDNSGVVSFVVMNGLVEVGKGGGASGANIAINVSGLVPNTEYTLHVIAADEAGNEAEPVAVQLTTQAAPAAAPKPSFTGKTAVAVFCDELDGAPAIGIGGWGQSTQVVSGQLAEGDNVFYCTNMNYLGWELTPAVDATDMEYLHADFYTANLTSISLTPISPDHEGTYTAQLTANAWTGVDVPLSAYAGKEIVWSNIFQFKFMDATPVGGELFIDNVYFYKPTTSTGVENALSEGAVSKYIENGTLYIVRDGKTYTIQGVRVR